MTSKERVKRTIKFENPDCLAVNFDSNRVPNGKEYGEDMMWVFAKYKEHVPYKEGYLDEWGVYWKTGKDDFSRPNCELSPLLGRETLEGYKIPDYSQDFRYENAKKLIEEEKTGKYILGMPPHALNQTVYELFGFEDFMVNVGINEGVIIELSEILEKSLIKIISQFKRIGADGIILIDDIALQDRPMMSAEKFRKIFIPSYKRVFEHCHNLGIDTFMHSCGNLTELLPDLITAGLDVINLDQQDNMGMQYLSDNFRGKVCFFNPLDIQRSQYETKEQIAKRVEEMLRLLATKNGGFIAKTYPDPVAIAQSDEYLEAMTSEFNKQGNRY